MTNLEICWYSGKAATSWLWYFSSASYIRWWYPGIAKLTCYVWTIINTRTMALGPNIHIFDDVTVPVMGAHLLLYPLYISVYYPIKTRFLNKILNRFIRLWINLWLMYPNLGINIESIKINKSNDGFHVHYKTICLLKLFGYLIWMNCYEISVCAFFRFFGNIFFVNNLK